MEEFRLEIEEDGKDPTSISVKHPMRYKWGLPQNLRLQHCCSDSHRLIPPSWFDGGDGWRAFFGGWRAFFGVRGRNVGQRKRVKWCRVPCLSFFPWALDAQGVSWDSFLWDVFFFRTHDKFLLEREEQIFHVAMFWWPEGSFSLRFLVQTWSLKITISICSLFWSEG